MNLFFNFHFKVLSVLVWLRHMYSCACDELLGFPFKTSWMM